MSAISDILVSHEGTRVVRERVYSPQDFERLLLAMSEERLCGAVILDFHMGGVRNIRVVEEQKIQNNS